MAVRGRVLLSSVAEISKQTLQAAFANAPAGIGICDEDGRFLAVSRSLGSLLGRPAENLVGRPFLAFVHPEQRSAALAAYFEAVVAVAAGVRGGSRELRCVTRAGQAIPVLVEWTVADPDESGQQRGIVYLTDQRGARRRRPTGTPVPRGPGREFGPAGTDHRWVAERRLQAFITTSDEIVWELDAAGVITYVSAAVERHLGYRPIELVGRGWEAIMPVAEQVRARLVLRNCATPGGGWADEEFVVTAKSGQLRSFWSSGLAQADERGTALGFAGTMRPVHEGDRTGRDQRLHAQLREIIDRGLIEPVFQPIVDLRRGSAVAVEAFGRFPASIGRSPALLFSDAAVLGLAVDLDLAAIHTALAAARELPQDVSVSINVSPHTLRTDRLPAVIADAGWDPTRIIIELTEQVPVNEYAPIVSALREIRSRGCRLAIDDAGAGYASFKHILALAPDLIKLDRFLITDVDTDPARRALIKAVVTFAAEVGGDVTAEGIESAAQATAVEDLGVHYGQGYHLGKPVPVTHLDLATSHEDAE